MAILILRLGMKGRAFEAFDSSHDPRKLPRKGTIVSSIRIDIRSLSISIGIGICIGVDIARFVFGMSSLKKVFFFFFFAGLTPSPGYAVAWNRLVEHLP